MIQPIFFPFTHIQESDVKAISSLFKSILFFPVSTPAEYKENEGYMEGSDLLLPVYIEDEDFEQVLQKVKEYRSWGELHKDNRGNLKTFLQDQPYLTDPVGIANIRSGITNKTKEIEEVPTKEDSLIKSLMFLRLAKIHDLEKETLSNQLLGIAKDEQKLFSEIRGLNREYDENNDIDGLKESLLVKDKNEDPGAYMTAERIGAWVDFFNIQRPFSAFDSSLLFVTTSPAVMEYLMSVAKNKIKLLDIDNLKVHENKCGNKNQWVEVFHKYVDNLVKSGQQALNVPAERDDNCTLVVKIKLYLLQGDDISSFFQGIDQNVPVCFISV
jgi:hypothetical protein